MLLSRPAAFRTLAANECRDFEQATMACPLCRICVYDDSFRKVLSLHEPQEFEDRVQRCVVLIYAEDICTSAAQYGSALNVLCLYAVDISARQMY